MAIAEMLSQAEFAARMGWHRSTVTRLKQHGRLVMDGPRVDVAASLARIEATGGMRADVAERHAAQRGAVAQHAAQAPSAADGQWGNSAAGEKTAPAGWNPPGGESRADAQARKEAALADKAEMEVQQMRGALIPRDDVDAALRTFAASVRARLDVMPDQLAPLVAPVTDLGEAHAILAGHARAMLAEVAADLAKAAQVAAQGESQPRLDGA